MHLWVLLINSISTCLCMYYVVTISIVCYSFLYQGMESSCHYRPTLDLVVWLLQSMRFPSRDLERTWGSPLLLLWDSLLCKQGHATLLDTDVNTWKEWATPALHPHYHHQNHPLAKLTSGCKGMTESRTSPTSQRSPVKFSNLPNLELKKLVTLTFSFWLCCSFYNW